MPWSQGVRDSIDGMGQDKGEWGKFTLDCEIMSNLVLSLLWDH